MRFIQSTEWNGEGLLFNDVTNQKFLDILYDMGSDMPIERATEAVNAVDNQKLEY